MYFGEAVVAGVDSSTVPTAAYTTVLYSIVDLSDTKPIKQLNKQICKEQICKEQIRRQQICKQSLFYDSITASNASFLCVTEARNNPFAIF